jgi:RNA polymerase sigma-70 factor (ECF subfamily)
MGAAIGRSTARLESILEASITSPSGAACRNENTVLLADRIARLPEDYRDVLVLRHLEGLPFEEVGRRMGRSSGAVRMLWLRALEHLRQLLRVEGL